ECSALLRSAGGLRRASPRREYVESFAYPYTAQFVAAARGVVMSALSFDRAELLRVMPVAVIGEVSAITPIRMGLSGAGVYGVTSDRGEYVLRMKGDGAD